MNFLEQNHTLWDLGFNVIPLRPRSKSPIEMNWTKKDRRSWDELVKNYAPPMNLGVSLGEKSRFEDDTYLCVLDCDVKSTDPIHLAEMQKALENFCPAAEFAPRVLSGRGGGSCHIYFRTRNPQNSFKAARSAHRCRVFMPSVPASNSDENHLSLDEIKAGYRMRSAWELDVLGNGKQAVLPPSVHPDSGKSYEWEGHPPVEYTDIPLIAGFLLPQKNLLEKKTGKNIKHEDVDLLETSVSSSCFDLVTRGEGFERFPSRSEAIFSALNGLVHAGLTDGQILKVMTDSEHFISEKPLEVSGGDVKRASKWVLSQLEKIRAEFSAVNAFKDAAIVDDIDEILALSPEEALAQKQELIPWEDKLETTRNGYRNTFDNLLMILEHTCESKAIFGRDEFHNKDIYLIAPPWGTKKDIGRAVIDKDLRRIMRFFSKEWGIEIGMSRADEIVQFIAESNAFHPVQDYLNSLKWDGVSRLDTMLEKYWGAVGNEQYLKNVGRKFMTAAVARVFSPGIKFDHIVIFEGEQASGKSTSCAILGGKWFSDSLGDISGKEAIENIQGNWIIEIGELKDMNKSDINSFKEFVSKGTDRARMAYGRKSQEFPRQCIFLGTTNNFEYLKDETGARRFWPIETTTIDTDSLRADRDQLWAEAKFLFDNAERLYLDAETEAIAREVQSERYVVDEMETTIERILNLEDFNDVEFTFDELWKQYCIETGILVHKECDKLMQNRLKKIFIRLGYVRGQRKINRKVVRIWIDPERSHRTPYRQKPQEGIR